jgi:hypothetical protein
MDNDLPSPNALAHGDGELSAPLLRYSTSAAPGEAACCAVQQASSATTLLQSSGSLTVHSLTSGQPG